MLVMVTKNAKEHKYLKHTKKIYSQYLRHAMDEFVHVNSYQSEAAKVAKAAKEKIVSDHVVPHDVLIEMLFSLDELSPDSVWEVIEKYYVICKITRKEDEELSKAGFKSEMPEGWCKDSDEVFARYERVGITYSRNRPRA
jgi:hypothetical protein